LTTNRQWLILRITPGKERKGTNGWPGSGALWQNRQRRLLAMNRAAAIIAEAWAGSFAVVGEYPSGNFQ
jgi:hypothetical protein